MKRFLCLILSLVLAFQFSTVCVQAKSSDIFVDCNKIIEALQANEHIKSKIGLENVDFSKFYIANPIYSYTYCDNGINESSIFVPLLENGKLRAFAIEDNGVYHISTVLAKIVEQTIDKELRFAFLFDKDSSFLFDGEQLTCLTSSNVSLTDRAELSSVNQIIGNENIVLSSITEGIPLGYTSVASARIPIYYECDVNYVPQGNYDICWAASIACVVNYKNNLNLTAVQVAQTFYGSNFNKGITIGQEATILQSYGLSYTTLKVFATDGEILSNIKNDYPVYSTCSTQNSTSDHDVVIYGINISSPYLYVMDPNFGSAVAYYDSSKQQYYYYYSGSSVRYYFKYSTCRYWSH